MSQTSDGENSRLPPTKTTLMLHHKLFRHQKVIATGRSESRICDLRVGIYGELGAPACSGDLGASPPVVSSGKAPGGVGGLCPLKLTNYQQMIHSFPNKTHIKYGKILEQYYCRH